MARKRPIKLLVALCACGLISAMFATGAVATVKQAASPFPVTGACDKSKTPIDIGIETVFESPVLTLVDQVDAAKAAVVAFNKKYSGVGGHCLNLTACDDKADVNQAADCARQLVANSKIVATVNDTTSFGTGDVAKIFADAGLPRVGISPGIEDLSSPVAYTIGAGGVGTTFMMAPPLLQKGDKKLYMIGVDTPTIGQIPALMDTMIKSYGGQFVGLSKVAAGTTDFQQFILAAQDAGADGVMLPLGDNEATQVLQAAQQLGSKLDFSASLGTFGKTDIQKFGKFAKQIHFNAELPPITASAARWPILPIVAKDLAASGKKDLQPNAIKSSPFRSWVAVYHLKEILEKFGDPNNVTRESVTAAMNKATDVDTFGLIPPWTPNKPSELPGVLKSVVTRVSNPWYYSVSWNGKQFVVGKNQLNLIEELSGNQNYPQQAAAS
jgi:branched-chain amino acid transport system substrate-binding protein